MPYIPMKPLLQHSQKFKYAYGAYNINLPVQAEAAIEMAEKLRSALIIQVAEPALSYLGGNANFLNGSFEDQKKGAYLIVEKVKKLAGKTSIPVVLHLDHGRSFETVKMVIDAGFSSVMIDASHLEYEENIKITKRVVDYAHQFGTSVEAELGILAGTEDHVFSEKSTYTNPLKVVDFFQRTKCDSLAISYGTKHGPLKGENIKLRKEIVIAAIENLHHQGIEGYLVSHGSSLVPENIISEINALGGNVSGYGVPISQLQEAISLGISKVNIDTDIRLATTRNFWEFFTKNPKKHLMIQDLLQRNPTQIDYRNYLSPILQDLLEERADEEIMLLLKNAVSEIVATSIVLFSSNGQTSFLEGMTSFL